jgi:poly(rC)-binding protein 3/4
MLELDWIPQSICDLCSESHVRLPLLQRGENIKRLRREANADFVVEDFVAGSEDRVMTVILHRDAPHHIPGTSGGDALVAVFDSFCEMRRDCLTANSSEETELHLGGPLVDEDASMTTAHAHLIDDDEFEFRLLVDSTQVGFLVGKNGVSIKKTMEDTGAHMRVLPKADLPSCAWVSDEVILLSGQHYSICSALRLVARQLEQYPPRTHFNTRRPPMLLAHASTGDATFMTQHPSATFFGGLASPAGLMAGTIVETVFRLLAPVSRAGNIIGRNGEHIRRVRTETGARIKVYGSGDDAEERLVCIYSAEDASSQYCSAQDALVRCAIALTTDDAGSGQHRVRLLAPQTSIGAVLGKKGMTVMQLRQETGAQIRVYPVEAPLAAAAATAHGGGEPGGDEVIQIDGSLQQCITALRGVATLLRAWQVRRAAASVPRTMAAVTLTPTLFAQPLTLGATMAPGLVQFAIPMTTTASSYALSSPLTAAPSNSGPVLWRYRLSNAQAGAVIGKGGHHVTQIRQLTGARVHLPSDQGTESMRTLEISGPVESCQAAHTMVNQFLALGQCAPALPEHQSGAVVFSPTASSPLDASPRSPGVRMFGEDGGYG